MRVIGIVSELKHKPGVYGQDDLPDDLVNKVSENIGSATTISGVLLSVVRGTWWWSLLFGPVFTYVWQKIIKSPPLRRLDNFKLPTTVEGTDQDQFPPEKSIVIPANLFRKGYTRHKDPVVYGLFRTEKELNAVVHSEGGNVDIWIMRLSDAKKRFEHFGGESGQFSTGLYLPHPKAANILVPVRKYSDLLQDEIHQEWVRAFEALGAKEIIICDTTEFKGESKATGKPSGVNVVAELDAKYGKYVVKKSSYETGTFDPQRAFENKRWIGDFSQIQSVIEGRVHGRQQSYEEKVTVDVAFGLSVKALKAWGINFKGGFKREFTLGVQFYPK